MKPSKIITKCFFLYLFLSSNTQANTDIDLDDDGLVDEGSYTTNLLANADFTQSEVSWDVLGLQFHSLEGRSGAESTMLGSSSGYTPTTGSATQVVTMASIGFGNTDNLDSVLAASDMKVVFGAWHSTANLNTTLSEITLTFLDEDGVAIGDAEVLSPAGTNDYEWKERTGDAVIPVGTRAISFRIDIFEPRTSGVWVKVDDTFLTIQPAEDKDLDAVLDFNDIDNDNDGLVDEGSYTTNLLSNGDFTRSGESWDVSGLNYHVMEARSGAESTMLGSSSGYTPTTGSATQVVTMASIGFGNTDNLDSVLAASDMKVVFGAWHSTANLNTTLSEITLTFLDEDGVAIGDAEVLSPAGTDDYEWRERTGEAIIPVGTRAISYQIDMFEPRESGVWVKVDDTFLTIQPAEDKDLDAVLDFNDIDNDNDGLVDEGSYTTNLLSNGDFTRSGESWDVSGLNYHVMEARSGAESTMLGSSSGYTPTTGSATQVVTMASIGFGNTDNLDSVLAASDMKVVFGAWHSTANLNTTLSEITLTFLDEDGVAIGDAEVLSPAGTNDYEWRERTGEAIIPVGTRAISYQIDMFEPRESGVWVKVDDTFLTIQPAEDKDLDAVLDFNDIDNDNDGLVDEGSYTTNLLSNGDFTRSGESWDVSGLNYHVMEARSGAESTMLGSSSGYTPTTGSATQVVTMASIGFGNTDNLDSVLAASDMKVVFGAWHSTANVTTSLSGITLAFLDEAGVAIGDAEVLSPEGTNDFEWKKRTGEAVIPVGTRAVSFKIDMVEPRTSGVWVKLDEAFIYIHDLSDHDNDGLGYTEELQLGTNPGDADTDNDGISDGYEVAYGLDPTDRSDGRLDSDDDGLSNFAEFSLGTDIGSNDSDGDGIPDGEDNFPSEPKAELSGLVDIINAGDINNDGISDFISIVVDGEGDIAVGLRTGDNIFEKPEKAFTASAEYQETQVILLDDMSGNEVPDIGLFGMIEQESDDGRKTLKPRLEVIDPIDGSIAKFNWPANWIEASIVKLDDINGNGTNDIALQGRFLNGELRPQLFAKDGATGEKIAVYGFPNLYKDPQWHQHGDVNGDDIPDIALSGQLLKNGKYQVKVVNAKVFNDRLISYNFPDKWDNASWHKLSDINSDEVADWGMLGIRKDDGRTQLFTKSGNEVRGTLGLFAWPEGMQNITLSTVSDMDNNGIDEISLSGFRTDVSRHQIAVKSGSDRNDQLLRITWADNYADVIYHVINDIDGNGIAEFGLMGKDTRANQYVLSIAYVDESLAHETKQVNLGNDWQKAPSVILLDDEDNDGMKELLFYGNSNSGSPKIRKVASPL